MLEARAFAVADLDSGASPAGTEKFLKFYDL
jgi:hypothetical protein